MSDGRWRVPGYVVDAPLGHGAASSVWRGRTALRLEPVALKRIEVRNEAVLAAAYVEAARLAGLDHPHLIRLHELVTTDHAAVLVLDLAGGGSLRDLLAVRGRLTPGEVITAIAPVAGALAYAHDAGLVHGDVSAGNILFTNNGRPMLADLGMSRLFGHAGPPTGTPVSIDPAVAAGGLPHPSSDVFSLAAVAVHALTGSVLWPGATTTEVLAAARSAGRVEIVDLERRLINAGVGAEMRVVLLRALSLEPARRGGAVDLALDLRSSGRPVAVELAAGRLHPSVSTPAPSRPAPVVPAPAAEVRAASAPAESSVGPAPIEPAPIEPAPIEPAPIERVPGDPAQTHGLRPAPRPATPRRRGHRYRTRRVRGEALRRHRRWALVGLAAVLLGGSAAWASTLGGHQARSARSATTPVLALSPAGVATGTPSDIAGLASAGPDGSSASAVSPSPTSSSAPAPATGPLTAAAAGQVLAGLDAIRQKAFSTRAPLLLAQVYVPGPLLDADTALLQRVVPDGCGLDGVITTYSAPHIVTASSNQVQVGITATLGASVLFCNGVAEAQAAASAAKSLQITLVRSGTGYLISAITG